MQIEWKGQGLLARVLSFVTAVVALVVAFTFSVLLFAFVVTGALLLWGYVWWRTRKLRREPHGEMHERQPDGHVIEGEVIRSDRSDDQGG